MNSLIFDSYILTVSTVLEHGSFTGEHNFLDLREIINRFEILHAIYSLY